MRSVVWMFNLRFKTPLFFFFLLSGNLPVMGNISLLSAMYCKKLHWWELGNILVYGDKNKSLGVILIVCLFNWMISTGFSLGTWKSVAFLLKCIHFLFSLALGWRAYICCVSHLEIREKYVRLVLILGPFTSNSGLQAQWCVLLSTEPSNQPSICLSQFVSFFLT